MPEVQNRLAADTVEVAPELVFSFSCEAIETDVPLDEQFCCGERLVPVLVEGRRVAKCRHCNRQLFEPGQIHDARSPWIGVDLDGTLAADTGGVLWDRERRPRIGRPVEEMVVRIQRWLADGCTVKVFTARASSPAQVSAIRAWLKKAGLPDLEVTNVKDLNMVELWDDRCVEVIRNSGRPVNPAQKRRVVPSSSSSTGRRRSRSGLLFGLKQFFLAL